MHDQLMSILLRNPFRTTRLIALLSTISAALRLPFYCIAYDLDTCMEIIDLRSTTSLLVLAKYR